MPIWPASKRLRRSKPPRNAKWPKKCKPCSRERYSGEQQSKPGEPVLVFVARLTDAQRDAGLAAAFKQAHDHAQRLAKAAGVSLGPLVHLNDVSDPSLAELVSRQRMEMYSPGGFADSQQPWQPLIDAEENELTSRKPDEVEFRVGLEAVFAINSK